MAAIMVFLGILAAMPVAGILTENPLLFVGGLMLGVPAHITAWIIGAIVRDTRPVTPGMRGIKDLVAISYLCGLIVGFVLMKYL
jgi:hypothetical protein